ncbi:MAG: phosphoglycerate kinase [Lentisphaeria bacterium]|nr:phosphoglycerate kinase [Candidatus Neomarinimicrobiota bacterium]MCF7842247.1 phosphoglycerate kinase [Lentisphaeria bacterium]
MLKPKSVEELAVRGKRVFVRTDYNVPLNAQQEITDDLRIQASLPTIQYLLDNGAAVILASHLGRPKGERIPEMSLAPVAERLSQLLGRPVEFVQDCIGETVEAKVSDLQPGQVLLLENLRFHAAETKNDAVFSAQLARLADVYVNDAFGTAHRAHASNVGITEHFAEKGAGFLLMKEVEFLVDAIENPRRPFTVVMGGAKISGKIDLIKSLAERADYILVGGGMAFTFLAAAPLRHDVGSSLVETDKLALASEIMAYCANREVNLVLPTDCVAAESIGSDVETRNLSIRSLTHGLMGLDIGPQTLKTFESVLKESKTVLWNGPMGVFEHEPFAAGTRRVAETLAALTENGATTIVGGGDSAAALAQFGLMDRVTHVSTGGGASLELLSGKTLPAFEALKGE